MEANKEWITKEEAIKRCKAVAATIPGAKFENWSFYKQVRLSNGQLTCEYRKAYASEGGDVKGMYCKCRAA